MSYLLKTYSRFLYGLEVDEFSYTLAIKEGTNPTVKVEIDVGGYTPEQLKTEIERQLNSQLTQDYTVSFNRTTRKYTISCNSNFRIMGATGGDNGTTILPLIGFQLVDTSPAASHTGVNSVGTVYEPQFWLQNYIPSDHAEKSAFSTVNKSASGRVQVQKFGEENFMECSIEFITEIDQGDNAPIKNNPNAISDTLDFLRWLKKKYPVEFMKDKNNVNDYEILILEKTEFSGDGTGFKLKEMYDRGLNGYFETGNLTFRRLDE